MNTMTLVSCVIIVMKTRINKREFTNYPTLTEFIKLLCQIRSASVGIIKENLEKAFMYENMVLYERPIHDDDDHIYLYPDDADYVLSGIDIDRLTTAMSFPDKNKKVVKIVHNGHVSDNLLQAIMGTKTSPQRFKTRN